MRVLFFVLPLLVLLASACNRCPSDVRLGDLQLQPSTKAFIPYKGGETLVFVSDAGEEISFEIPRARDINEPQELIVENTCSKGSFLFPKSTNVYYEAERFSLYTASDETQTRTLLLSALIYNDRFGDRTDTLLYELISVTAQFDEEVASFQFLSSDRGNPQVLIEHPDGFDSFHAVGDTTLLDRPFEEVRRNIPFTSDDSMVFYNAKKGIIGIKTRTRFWVLDRGI